MKKQLQLVIILAVTALMLFAGASLAGGTEKEDLVDIETVAGFYLNSGRTGDVQMLRSAFHPSLRLQFSKEGNYAEWSGKEFLSWSKPGVKSEYESRILFIDCAGDAAMVKAEMVFENVKYTDYLSMLRIEGRWWIVNKIFDEERTVGNQ